MNIHLKTQPARARGMLLIEILAYLAIFVLVLGFAFTAFYDCWNNSDAFGRDAGDITRALRAGEQWRADIRAATGPVEGAASNGVQTLRIPTGAGAILYTFANSELCRNGPPAGDTPILSHIKSSSMRFETHGNVAALRWELELLPRRHNPKLHALFTFAAVPRGETSP